MWSRLIPARVSWRGRRTWPPSTTTRTPSTVRLDSAMSVANTTRRPPRRRGGQGPVLVLGGQVAEQRAHVHVGGQVAEATGHLADGGGAGQEDEDVAGLVAHGLVDHGGHRVERSRPRGGWPPAHVDGEGPTLAGDHGGRVVVAAEETGQALGVEGGGHGQQAQVGTQARPDVEGEGQGEVGLEVALVDLVEDHQGGAGEGGVGLQAPGEDPLGDHLDAGGGARPGARRGCGSRPSPPPPRPAGRPCAGPPRGRRGGAVPA